jgi:hypothetical protein
MLHNLHYLLGFESRRARRERRRSARPALERLEDRTLPASTLFNINGTIAGIPYVDVVAGGSSLAAGQSVTVTLYFKAAKNATITYDATKVLEGI